MTPVIVFPDAAALALEQLAAELPDLVGAIVPTGTRVPNPRPERFVTCRRTGGTRVTPVTEAAMLSVECWGETIADAEDLAQNARAVLFGMAGQTYGPTPVYRVDDVGGPNDAPDELSDQPRASFSVAVHLRGRPPT